MIAKILAILAFAASCSAGLVPVSFIGKNKDKIKKELSNLERRILHQEADDAETFRYDVRMYVMGCFMVASSEPVIEGSMVTHDTRYADVAAKFLSDVAFCTNTLRTLGSQLKGAKRLGESIVVKELVVILNDIDFRSSPDARISNAIQWSIDLGSLCFEVGNYDCSLRAFANAANVMISNNVENDELCGLIAKIANSKFKAGNYSDAVDSYDQALKYLRKIGSVDKDMFGVVSASLAASMFQLQNFVGAEKTYKSALKYLNSAPQKNVKLIASASKDLASSLFAQRLWIDAADQYESALKGYVSVISDTDNDPQNDSAEFTTILAALVTGLRNAANDALEEGRQNDARVLLERAEEANRVWSKKLEDIIHSTENSVDVIQTEIYGIISARALLRVLFAGVVGFLIFVGMKMSDITQPFAEQVSDVQNKIATLMGLHPLTQNMENRYKETTWASVPTPEQYPKSTLNSIHNRANSPERFFNSQPVAPVRHQRPAVYIPSE